MEEKTFKVRVGDRVIAGQLGDETMVSGDIICMSEFGCHIRTDESSGPLEPGDVFRAPWQLVFVIAGEHAHATD